MTDPVGFSPRGEAVHAVKLQCEGLGVTLWTLGAMLQDIRISGHDRPLVLSVDDPARCTGALQYAGAVVGPVANRIRNAALIIADKTHRLEPNERSGHMVHCANSGLNHRIWQVEHQSSSAATLRLGVADGEDGLPGDRVFRATYGVHKDMRLSLHLSVMSNKQTVANLAHHPFWNLDAAPNIDGHTLWIDAPRYLPTDDTLIPTGERFEVAGTDFDFTQNRQIGSETQIDHNFCTAPDRIGMRPVARLTGVSGLSMEIRTTEPGLQVFDGFSLEHSDTRLTNGQTLGPRAGIALEPQCWPDAPGREAFPSIDLMPDVPYAQTTEYAFSLK